MVHPFLYSQNDTINLPLNEALKYYQTLTEKNPESEYAFYGLAKCYYLADDFANVEKICKKHIRIQSDTQIGFSLLYAMSLNASGRMEKAIQIINNAINDNKDNHLLYFHRAMSNYKLSNLTEAYHDILQSISIDSNLRDAHILLSFILYELKNDPQTIMPLFYALYLSPDGDKSKEILYIIHSLLQLKHDKITLPFKEKRFAIKSVYDIVDCYISESRVKDWEPSIISMISLSSEYIQAYASSSETINTCYPNLFGKLINSVHLSTFCYVVLQSLNNNDVIIWYKQNSEQLTSFADWMEVQMK